MAEGVSRWWRGWELDCRGVWWEPKQQSERWLTELGYRDLLCTVWVERPWHRLWCFGNHFLLEQRCRERERQSAVTPSGNPGIEGRPRGPQHLWRNECFSLHEGLLWLPLALLWLGLPSIVAKVEGCWHLVRLYQPSQSPWTKRTWFWIAQLLDGLATALHTTLPQENWH